MYDRCLAKIAAGTPLTERETIGYNEMVLQIAYFREEWENANTKQTTDEVDTWIAFQIEEGLTDQQYTDYTSAKTNIAS